VVDDTFSFATTVGPVEIVAAGPEGPPFAVDAFVEEQDTCLMLGTEAVMRDTREGYPLLVKKMIGQKPRAMSEVIVTGDRPLRLTAIVYDIDQKTICREDWISDALKNIFNLCRQHKVRFLAMPLLGTLHGKIGKEQFLDLLKSALSGCNSVYPEKIWLVIKSGEWQMVKD